MALNLLGIKQSIYRGQPFNVPVGEFERSRVPPQACVFTINWGAYGIGPDIAVQANVNAAPSAALDIIKSVKIDNTGNPFPVYVIFPDSGDVVACDANATHTSNVISLSTTPIIACPGVGSTSVLIPAAPVYFSNVYFSNARLETDDTPLQGLQYILDSNFNQVTIVAADRIGTCTTNFDNSVTTVLPAIGGSTLNYIIAAFSLSVIQPPSAGVPGTWGFTLGSGGFSQQFGFTLTASSQTGLVANMTGLRLKAPCNAALTFLLTSGALEASGVLQMAVYYGIGR